jgi:hypothetical protein
VLGMGVPSHAIAPILEKPPQRRKCKPARGRRPARTQHGDAKLFIRHARANNRQCFDVQVWAQCQEFLRQPCANRVFAVTVRDKQDFIQTKNLYFKMPQESSAIFWQHRQ